MVGSLSNFRPFSVFCLQCPDIRTGVFFLWGSMSLYIIDTKFFLVDLVTNMLSYSWWEGFIFLMPHCTCSQRSYFYLWYLGHHQFASEAVLEDLVWLCMSRYVGGGTDELLCETHRELSKAQKYSTWKGVCKPALATASTVLLLCGLRTSPTLSPSLTGEAQVTVHRVTESNTTSDTACA